MSDGRCFGFMPWMTSGLCSGTALVSCTGFSVRKVGSYHRRVLVPCPRPPVYYQDSKIVVEALPFIEVPPVRSRIVKQVCVGNIGIKKVIGVLRIAA